MNQRCWMVPYFKAEPSKIRVVLPVCAKDFDLMLSNLHWQWQLDGQKDYDCVLAVDGAIPPQDVDRLERLAWATYAEVEVYLYPPTPNSAWPNGPNWAFQHTARHMQPGRRPWFWMESDCIPLRPDWIGSINQAYNICHRPIFGPIVRGMGHCNGTAVYPADFPEMSKAAMLCSDLAWDGEMKRETIGLTCDASSIMCHVWGIQNGRAKPFGGEPAVFRTWRDVERWVDLNCVVFHRCKNETLIERIRERTRKLSPP